MSFDKDKILASVAFLSLFKRCDYLCDVFLFWVTVVLSVEIVV